MLRETKKIEEYLLKNYGGKIECAYGSSLGGSFVCLLIQRKRVSIRHGILGSSDLDQYSKEKARRLCKLEVPLLHGFLQQKTAARLIQKACSSFTKDLYYMKMFHLFDHMNFVKKQSIYNQLYSDMITPIDFFIEANQTTIHCFYAEKMGEKYLKRYYQYVKNPDIVAFPLRHEELLACYPEKWVNEIHHCVAIS